jgi:hypothetical protein
MRLRLSSPVTAAIFGLIGVVVGGLLTGGVDYFLQRRTDKAEQKRAKRLVGEEVNTIVFALEEIVEDGHLPTRGLTEEWRGQYLSVVEWPQQKTALALALNDDEWRALATFYYNVSGFRLMAVELGHGAALDEDSLRKTRLNVIAGREATRKLGLAPTPLIEVPDELDLPRPPSSPSPTHGSPGERPRDQSDLR